VFPWNLGQIALQELDSLRILAGLELNLID
jgi:hypothetical protein